jgi:hypothetical protein
MQPTNPQTNVPKPLAILKKAVFGGWLAKALTVMTLISAITVSLSVLTDTYYQQILTKMKSTTPKQAFDQFPKAEPTSTIIMDTPTTFQTIIETPIATNTPTATATPSPRITRPPGVTATRTPTPSPNPTQAPHATSTPTPQPQATNTSAPTATPTQAQIAGCYVIVAGYLYNMQSGIGVTATDQNTGKTRVHTVSDYTCGTQESPTDMTDTYIEKHETMGCSQRIAPYIVTPPAPTDPTC